MSRVRVFKGGWDWLAYCAEHDDMAWCGSWEDAMTAAYGHLAMKSHWPGGVAVAEPPC